jgi:integrase
MVRFITSVVLDDPGPRGSLLRFRVKWDGSRRVVSVNVGYRVDPSGWSPATCRCRRGTAHGVRRVPAWEVNAAIDAVEAAFRAASAPFLAEGRSPSVAEFRSAFRAALGKAAPARSGDIMRDLDDFLVDGSRSGWTDSTVRDFRSLRKHLTGFMKAGNARYGLDDFTTEVLSSYVLYLQDAGLMGATVAKNVGYLRWFLGWALEHGRTSRADFRDFRPKLRRIDRPVIWLEWDELMRVWSASLPPDLARVRDAFCFQCFTGLRWSDLAALRACDVSDEAVTVTTRKTSDRLRIELNSFSRAILARYRGYSAATGRPLPVLANQAMNRALKAVMRECGVDAPVRVSFIRGGRRVDEIRPKWELVGTHAGRRTFICMMLQRGVPPTVVMRWTGHSDYQAMSPYIAVSDKAKAEAMGVLDSVPVPVPDSEIRD